MHQLVLFSPLISGVLNLTAAGIGLTATTLSQRAVRTNPKCRLLVPEKGESQNNRDAFVQGHPSSETDLGRSANRREACRES